MINAFGSGIHAENQVFLSGMHLVPHKPGNFIDNQ